jgi:hypothetical protein
MKRERLSGLIALCGGAQDLTRIRVGVLPFLLKKAAMMVLLGRTNPSQPPLLGLTAGKPDAGWIH